MWPYHLSATYRRRYLINCHTKGHSQRIHRLFSSLFVLCWTPSREAVNTIFKVFCYDSTIELRSCLPTVKQTLLPLDYTAGVNYLKNWWKEFNYRTLSKFCHNALPITVLISLLAGSGSTNSQLCWVKNIDSASFIQISFLRAVSKIWFKWALGAFPLCLQS